MATFQHAQFAEMHAPIAKVVGQLEQVLGWKATVNEGGVVSKTLQVNHLQRMLSKHGEAKLCKQRTGNVKTAELLTILNETSEKRGCTSPRSVTYMHHDIKKLRASVIFVKFGGCTDQSALDKFEGFF